MSYLESQGTVFIQAFAGILERHRFNIPCQLTAFEAGPQLVEISFRQLGVTLNPVWCWLPELPDRFQEAAKQLETAAVSSQLTATFLGRFDRDEGTIGIDVLYEGNKPACFATIAQARQGLTQKTT